MPRLTIHLRKEYPLWALPVGQRSARVREALDLNLGLLEVLADIRNGLARIESRLDQSERCGVAASDAPKPAVAPLAEAKHADVVLDLAGFDDL
jgi:hypothetical protein